MRVADLVALLDGHYDPRWAEPWDAVGLVCGDPDTDVRRVHLAIDPVADVVEETISAGAQLLLTHHPLFLGGTTSVAATTAKGRVVQRLVTSGTALFVAHTNADVADPGVSDALAAALGVTDVSPLQPPPDTAASTARGLGRVGRLPAPESLRQFTARVARSLPRTAWGVRAAGDPDRPVRTVAVCGGSGGDLAEAALRAGADVLVTSDLKHHRTSEGLADGGVALVDAAHWATEWPWLEQVAGLLATTVEVSVSRLVTDPWTLHEQRDT